MLWAGKSQTVPWRTQNTIPAKQWRIGLNRKKKKKNIGSGYKQSQTASPILGQRYLAGDHTVGQHQGQSPQNLK